eukprot:Transcript_6829.p1 GENE.Transcript_6829~~Transcript_6829.p1  ORF type:complete len:947 (-),score=54.94 Transcript_6829:61-2679(-)
MQNDGNLCLYDGTDPQHTLGNLWCRMMPKCREGAGQHKVTVDDDAHLIVSCDTGPVWKQQLRSDTSIWRSVVGSIAHTVTRITSMFGSQPVNSRTASERESERARERERESSTELTVAQLASWRQRTTAAQTKAMMSRPFASDLAVGIVSAPGRRYLKNTLETVLKGMAPEASRAKRSTRPQVPVQVFVATHFNMTQLRRLDRLLTDGIGARPWQIIVHDRSHDTNRWHNSPTKCKDKTCVNFRLSDETRDYAWMLESLCSLPSRPRAALMLEDDVVAAPAWLRRLRTALRRAPSHAANWSVLALHAPVMGGNHWSIDSPLDWSPYKLSCCTQAWLIRCDANARSAVTFLRRDAALVQAKDHMLRDFYEKTKGTFVHVPHLFQHAGKESSLGERPLAVSRYWDTTRDTLFLVHTLPDFVSELPIDLRCQAHAFARSGSFADVVVLTLYPRVASRFHELSTLNYRAFPGPWGREQAPRWLRASPIALFEGTPFETWVKNGLLRKLGTGVITTATRFALQQKQGAASVDLEEPTPVGAIRSKVPPGTGLLRSFDAAMSRLAQSQSAADARTLAPLLLEQRWSRLAAKMRAAKGWAGKQQCGYYLPKREIFFTHTSKETALTRIGSCAVSSAAKVNPDWQVTVLSNGLANPKRRKRTAESFDLFPSWSGHNPPRVVRFDYGRIFAFTPFESWYKKKRVWSKHGFTSENLSNALRLALLYKFGGAYFDLDIVSVKPLPPRIWRRSAGLEREVPGRPEKTRLNGAVILMDKQAPFLKEAMKDYVVNFKNWVWGNQGPDLMTRVWNRTKLIDALPVSTFYPIIWGSPTMMSYFNQPEWDGAKEVLRETTVGIHLWNRATSKAPWHNKSFITHMLQRVC